MQKASASRIHTAGFPEKQLEIFSSTTLLLMTIDESRTGFGCLIYSQIKPSAAGLFQIAAVEATGRNFQYRRRLKMTAEQHRKGLYCAHPAGACNTDRARLANHLAQLGDQPMGHCSPFLFAARLSREKSPDPFPPEFQNPPAGFRHRTGGQRVPASPIRQSVPGTRAFSIPPNSGELAATGGEA